MLSLFLLFAFVSAPAQCITDALADMPENIIPTLTEENKRALLEDSTITIVKTLLGEITRVELRNDYIKLRTSAVGSTQIQLLNNEQGENLICVIQTVCAPACNSDIVLYNSNWELIKDIELLPELTSESFVTPLPKGDPYIVAHTLLPNICPILAQFNEDGMLVLQLDIDNYLSGEMLKEFNNTFEKRDLVLQWNGHTFR